MGWVHILVPTVSDHPPFVAGSLVESWRMALLARLGYAACFADWRLVLLCKLGAAFVGTGLHAGLGCRRWISEGAGHGPKTGLDMGGRQSWVEGLFISGVPAECGEGGMYLATLISLASRIVQFNGTANIFQVTQSLKCSSIWGTATRLGL